MNDSTTQNLINNIEQRPGMYLRTEMINSLCDFLNGYFMHTKNELTKGFSMDFWFFHEFIKNYYNESSSVSGWANMLLYNCAHDQEIAFHEFFKRYHEFTEIHVEAVFKATLDERNISFHTDVTKGKNLVVGLDLKQLAPTYQNPKSYLVLQLSKDNGYLLLVESDNVYYQERILFKDLAKINHEISSLFGTVQKQQQIELAILDEILYYPS
ncbi:hypothetical protein LMM12_000844 [Listeria monocytogenes]|nr:hypothetical protein [Listeria monocytogenes]